MRIHKFFGLVALVCVSGSLSAQDIEFSNRIVTFTNLQGRVYSNVTVMRANSDGILWRGDGMGLISYTNLSPAFLESLGVPTNRIEQARARAAQMATASARQTALQAQAQARIQARATNTGGQAQEVELIKLEGSLSAGRYKKCAVLGGDEVLIQLLPAPVEATLNNLGQQAAQIDYVQSWVETNGKALRHKEAAVRDANMANWNKPDAPFYYVRETAYASLQDAREELAKLQSAYAEYAAKTKKARTVYLKSADSYGDSPVWECTEPPKPQ